jgi:hypothetical protein
MTPQYQRQLDYIFNRPTDEPAWYWRNNADGEEQVFDETPLSAFTFLETLFLNPKEDLKDYSNDQIGLGLNFIFNNSCSNMTHDFKAANVPFDRKIKALYCLFALFRDVLNPRCVEVESAFSQAPLSEINYICYMLWDITPLSTASDFMFTESILKSELEQKPYKNSKLENHNFYAAIADVMKKCLYLSNPACIESGLHGLGHLATSYPNIAVPIIDDFLKKGKKSTGSLINYAKMARTGMIP